jgi:hypothetical protein
LSDLHSETVLDAFNNYKYSRRVRIDGIGKFVRNGTLSSVESVEHISVLDPLDVSYRLEELAQLKRGWLEGEGVALSKGGLKTIEADFIFRFPDDKMLPHIFPTPTGDLLLEWSTSERECTLEVNLITRKGHWTDETFTTGVFNEMEIDLTQGEDWDKMLTQLPSSEDEEASRMKRFY